MRRLIKNGNSPTAKMSYIGHYGHLRKAYLEGYRPDLYAALVASEKLYEHCAEIDAAARSQIDVIMLEFAKSVGATEELKVKDQLAEECVNDAYLGVWNAIPLVRPDPLLSYIVKIVRNISLKVYGSLFVFDDTIDRIYY